MNHVLTPSRIFIRLIKAIIFLAAILSSVFYKSLGQVVAVSAYLNKTDPRDEWTELIVNADNVDLRGWTIRDNSSGNNWQSAITFNNIAFWEHMRIGTIIMIWHRQTTSGGINHPVDINKTDGYIELYAFNPVYFTGGDITNTLNLSQTKDMIQLRNASGTHVHALAHGSPELGGYSVLPAPKLNHLNSSVADGDAIYVCPGAVLNDYGTNLPTSGTTYTSKNNSTLTFGLANTCVASATANKAYWRTIREPQIASQSILPSVIVPGMPGSVSFSWTGATDPYNTDTTVRYLILRNIINSFSPPTDGTTYSLGSILGSATVVGIITNSALTTFTDNTVMNGNIYYYRVYAYRNHTDDLNGNGYSLERGSAYNTLNFVSVGWPNSSPLPVSLINFEAGWVGHYVNLSWVTGSETNNDFYTIERSKNGFEFTMVGMVNGAGTSTSENRYSLTDFESFEGLMYYRLKQTDYNGQFTYSKLIAMRRTTLKESVTFSLFPNPASDNLNLSFSLANPEIIFYCLMTIQGKILVSGSFSGHEGENLLAVSLDILSKGLHVLRIRHGESSQSFKFVKF